MRNLFIILVSLIILLVFKPIKQLPTWAYTVIKLLSIWIAINLTLKFFTDEKPKRPTDMEMAKTFIQDNPKLCKGCKLKTLDDGTIKITTKKESFYLKDGVLGKRR